MTRKKMYMAASLMLLALSGLSSLLNPPGTAEHVVSLTLMLFNALFLSVLLVTGKGK